MESRHVHMTLSAISEALVCRGWCHGDRGTTDSAETDPNTSIRIALLFSNVFFIVYIFYMWFMCCVITLSVNSLHFLHPHHRTGYSEAHSHTQNEGVSHSHRDHEGPPGRRVRRHSGLRGNPGRLRSETTRAIDARWAERAPRVGHRHSAFRPAAIGDVAKTDRDLNILFHDLVPC